MDSDTTIDEEGLPDEAELITVCGGSVIIDQDSGVIRLVHYTTQEYFERHRSKIFPTAQAGISSACIRYLSLGDFKHGPCTTNFDLENRLNNFKLIEYAAHNWAKHAYGDLDEAIEEQAVQFLSNRSLLSSAVQAMWMYAYRHGVNRYQKYPKGVSGIAFAALFGLTSLIDKLLRLGNDIDESSSHERTALHEASARGHEDTLRLLLESGANLEVKEYRGLTALSLAAMGGLEANVQLLLNAGASIDTKDRCRVTALFWAAQKNHSTVAQPLLENGAGIEVKDSDGKTALFEAAHDGRAAIVELLLNNGANGEAMDLDGMGALFWAAENRHDAVVQLLLQNGVDTNEQDRDAIISMLVAAQNGDEAAVRMLLENGIEAGDQNAMTAVFLAARSGHGAVVQLMFEKWADVKKDQSGTLATLI